jgi:5'-3' exonuclease
MGIPRFAKWIMHNKRRQLTISHIPNNINSLSFDVNSIIHGCAQIVYGYGDAENDQRKQLIETLTDEQLESELFKLISDSFLRITQRVNPKKFLVLAVDGVAPLAKINQQRMRRYRMASSSTSPMRFDPNCITPGTDFMFRLDQYLQDWINANLSLLPEKVLYSNHLVPGEGEQKIFDYVRNFEISGYGAHIIYGLDADLIILSLISRLKGIYLIREKSLEINVYEKLIAIEELRSYLEYRMRTSTSIDDFAVLSFFLGNDFLPASPMFTGDMVETIEYLLDVYSTLRLPLTYPKEGLIDAKNLYKFISLIAQGENDRLKKVYQDLPKNGFKTLEMSVEHIFAENRLQVLLKKDEFRLNWYLKIISPPIEKLDLSFQLPEDIYLKIFEPTESKIKSLVQTYISGFFWVYQYYKYGTSAASPNYCYTIGYAPLIDDVHKHFPKKILPFKRDQVLKSYQLHILKQILAVLPPKSIKIIPSILHPYYHVDSPISDMFPSSVEVDLDGKDMDHMAVVRIPAIEPVRLQYLNVVVPNEMKFKYEAQENMMFMKQVRQTIDRSIIPMKIKLRKERTQESINPAEEFLNLDVEAAARIELIADIPKTGDIVVREGFEDEKVFAQAPKRVPSKGVDFRNQFDKIKNIRGFT